MGDYKQSPEHILEEISKRLEKKMKGRLKIFFGYAAGVGKTYAMLKAAHVARHKGIDVVAGYIEPHARPKTFSLLTCLESLSAEMIVKQTHTIHLLMLSQNER